MGGPTFEGVGGEAARVGKEVEHSFATGEPLQQEAVVALIEEEPGLLAAIEIGVQADAVFFYFDEFGWFLTRQKAGGPVLEPFGAAGTDIAALEYTPGREHGMQRVEYDLPLLFHARGMELDR